MSEKGFTQSGPKVSRSYESDPLLREYLKFKLTEDDFKKVDADLCSFSARIDNEIRSLGEDAEACPPTHNPFDPWGECIDEIITSKAWKRLDQISAQEGLVALGYERNDSGTHRLHQFSKLYLFHPVSAFYTCPLAMTDGAAKLIETNQFDEVKDAFEHIISRDPSQFWTSGQWMTERSGGSDVGRTETLARFEDGKWRLFGTKWFTSATTSQMAMTLARIVDESGKTVSGSRGLTLFCVRLRNDEGKLQKIKILRLKEKLGTKALPTAELELQGTPATLLGGRGEGVKTISTLFNVTRIYNACTTIGSFRNILNLSRNYSQKREAFKHKIIDWPLHAHMLASAEIEFSGLFMLAFFTTELLGFEECQNFPLLDRKDAASLLRLLTPISKLMCAKRNMIWTSEMVEGFGGAGYIEDTGIPKILRDSQVFPIWEGTTNVLSLDMLRAISEGHPIESYFKKLSSIGSNLPQDLKLDLQMRSNLIKKTLSELSDAGTDQLGRNARLLAFWIGETMALALLMEFTSRPSASKREKTILKRYSDLVQKDIKPLYQDQIDENIEILR